MGKLIPLIAFIIIVSLFVATKCIAQTDELHFVMEVEDVKTQTSGSGICIIYGAITEVVSKKGVAESNQKLKSGWWNRFEEGEKITVVAACKDKYFSEQLGVESLIKSSVKAAKFIEFWGTDLRDARYKGCERYRECDLSGRFIFSPKGAKILEKRE